MVSLFPHPASFRSHLAMDTLAFGCILPTPGRIGDLHPLETCAARRTTEKQMRISSDLHLLFYCITVKISQDHRLSRWPAQSL